MKLGIVVWVEGTTVKFRVNESVTVERGQLVKVEDKRRKFILRVYDFKPETLLTPAEIALVSRRKEAGEEVPLYDKGLRLYDTALATILCQVGEDGRVHGPTGVPPLFSVVESLGESDLKELHLDTGDLPIGWVRVGHRRSDVVVTLDGQRVIPHHILVCGVTGAGKSNLGKVLAAAIMSVPEPRYSLVIFDCESEYLAGAGPGQLGLAHIPQAEKRLFYLSPEVPEPSRLEFVFKLDGIEIRRRIVAYPLKVPLGELTPSDFAMTGEFTGPQEELLWMAFRAFGESWVSTLLKAPVADIYRRLRRLVSVNTISVSKRKLKYLLGRGEIFVEDTDYNAVEAVLGAVAEGRVILVDIPHTTEGEEKLLSTLIARRVFVTYERLRKDLPEEWERLPYALIMVEEAHRYLARQSLTSGGDLRENIFSVISKRGRKYKVGAIYITQMPGELVETVIRQTLTKIILPLPTRPDYMKVIQYSPYLDEAEQEIKTLDKGEALIVSPPSGMRFAVPVKIFWFEELAEEIIRAERETTEIPRRYA